MGVIADAFNPRPRGGGFGESSGPLSDFWYQDPSGFIVERGISGIAISAETMLNCGTVLAAVRFRGQSWAQCQPSTYQKTKKGREERPDHYSQVVLRDPNAWQTGYLWRQVNGLRMATWGNSYNEIIGGPRSFVEQLQPRHPQYTRVVDQRSDGSLVYRYEAPGEDARTIGQEQMLHFRDLSSDGISGLPMYRLIRNVVSIALLVEKHAASSLKKGSRLAGLLSPATPLDPGQRKDLRDSVNEDFGGSANTGTVGVLPHGVTWTALAVSNRESQFAELSDASVGAILRFLGVPGFVVGYQGDKANTYASAKETAQEALRSCVLPQIENVEEQEEKALLPRGSGLIVKHNLDTLLRVNIKDRYDANFKACGGPWMSRNEVRRQEDENPDPDPEMDKVLTPVNMAADFTEPPAPTPPQPLLPQAPPGDQNAQEQERAALRAAAVRAQAFAEAAAERVVRREIQAIQGRQGGGLAVKHAKDPQAWDRAIVDFYGEHAAFVAREMQIHKAAAAGYCGEQLAALRKGGLAVMESWESTVVPRLAAMGVGLLEEEAVP